MSENNELTVEQILEYYRTIFTRIADCADSINCGTIFDLANEALTAHTLFKSRMESESEDDFVTLKGSMTQEEVHEKLNALMLQFSKK